MICLAWAIWVADIFQTNKTRDIRWLSTYFIHNIKSFLLVWSSCSYKPTHHTDQLHGLLPGKERFYLTVYLIFDWRGKGTWQSSLQVDSAAQRRNSLGVRYLGKLFSWQLKLNWSFLWKSNVKRWSPIWAGAAVGAAGATGSSKGVTSALECFTSTMLKGRI